PLIRKGAVLTEVGWDEAIAQTVSELRSYKKSEIAGLGSSHATNEDNYIFQKLMKEVIGTRNIDYVSHIKEGDEDDLLIRADKTPNSLGCRQVGVEPAEGGLDLRGIIRGIDNGGIKVLYALEDDLAGLPELGAVLQKLDLLIVHSSVQNETTAAADIVLSCSTYAEKNGTFVNFQGRIQRIRPAVATLEQDRAKDGLSMSRWDRFASQNDRWGRPLKKDARPTWRILVSIASALGAKWKFNLVEDVFKEISERIPSFKGMSYLKVGTQGSMLKSEKPVHA
ncbi:MAG: molybdopterin-dependent oxidoreductase, partial [Ignavibacteriales bacterium]|nr:molybdopterin-dependent oxidoreductase [Ignavibacteriales bacterium]